MGMTNAYEKPNGSEIRRLRKIKGWSREYLARTASVSASTVKRAERSQSLQVRNLAKIAHALQVPLEVIAPGLRTFESSIRVFHDWGHADRFIARAEHSVLIIDSYLGEYGRLGLALRTRSRNHLKLKNLEIYMASPEMDFGAQRRREAQTKPKLNVEKRAFELWDQVSDSARNSYEEFLHSLAESIISAANPYAERVVICEYRCMPVLRIIAIDDLNFIFGWFPLFLQNPGHTCFYIRDGDLGIPEKSLIGELRTQIDNVRSVSEPVLKKENRQRLNRTRTIAG